MIINRSKINKLAVAVVAACSTLTASAFSASSYTSESVLNDGDWVKIKITENGIHQFTYDQLRAMGFKNPANVSVYGYGGSALTHNTFKTTDVDDLPQLYVLHTDDRIIFYGESGVNPGVNNSSVNMYSLKINYYSQAGYYFLTDKTTPKSVERVERNMRNTDRVTTHKSVQFIDFNKFNPGRGGVHYFGDPFSEVGSQPHIFTVTDPATGGIGYAAYTGACKNDVSNTPRFNMDLDSDLSVRTGNNAACSRKGADIELYDKVSGYKTFNLRNEGSNDYTVNVYPDPTYGTFKYSALDWLYFAYDRNNKIDAGQLRMVFPGARSSDVIVLNAGDIASTLEVWDITSPYKVRRYNTYANEGEVQFTPDRNYNTTDMQSLYVMAFDRTATFPTPEVVGPVKNQNLHGQMAPHMLIITNNECQESAERLAEAHRQYQGIDVLVANQEEVFNEFSSGTPDALAYRRVAKMLYDRNPSKFRSVLLFGPGHYDNRKLIFDIEDALLTYQVEDYAQSGTNATNYASDDYFGMLNDYFSVANITSEKMQVAVGRIPAKGADVKPVTDKIIEHIAKPYEQATRNRALMIADDNDSNKHELQAEGICSIIDSLAPQVTCTRVFNNVYPWNSVESAEMARAVITEALTQGMDYVCYTGHAGPQSFGGEDLWHRRYVSSVNYNHYPIWMLATCDTYGFDRYENGIGERLVLQPNGGAIAVIGAGRTVYADSNYLFSQAVAEEYAKLRGRSTIGEIYRNARNQIASRTQLNLRVNTMCYNLCGDPEVPYYSPELVVEAQTINDVSTSGNPHLYPLHNNVISGIITDEDGHMVDNFSGDITITIFNDPQTIRSNPKDGKSDPRDVTLDESTLAEAIGKVENGHFSVTINLPITNSSVDVVNRLTFFAVNNDRSLAAVGHCHTASIADYDPAVAIVDNNPPLIEECYVDDPAFADGDIVYGSPTFYAKISDEESGIKMSTQALIAGVTLILDNNRSFSTVRNAMRLQEDGSVNIQLPISDLNDGRHSLTLNVTDNAGNMNSRTINFTVVNRSSTAQLSLEKEAVRTSANFDVIHSFTDQVVGRLIVEDAAGNVVYSRTNCTFPFEWNLKDADNNDVASGAYRCYAILNAGRNYGSTDRIDLVIVR